jgi:hypothetical protein
VSPAESWAFLALTALILAGAFIGAGRAFDWMLDRLFRPDSGHRANPRSSGCPCGEDRDYHDRMARGL